MQTKIRFSQGAIPFHSTRSQTGKSRSLHLQIHAAVKRDTLRNVVCSKTLKIKEGCNEQVEKLCKEIADFAHQEMKDTSKGILAFEVFQDPFEEKHIHFWERYLDNTRLGRFNTCDTFQEFMKNVQDHLDKPVGMALYEWRNGQLGPLCVQGGPKGISLFLFVSLSFNVFRRRRVG